MLRVKLSILLSNFSVIFLNPRRKNICVLLIIPMHESYFFMIF